MSLKIGKTMETLVIVSEADIKKWIREAIREEMSTWLTRLESREFVGDEPLLTREQMAHYLHVSLPTLRDWVNQGLPCVRKGRRVLFLKTAVLKAMKDRPARNAAVKKTIG